MVHGSEEINRLKVICNKLQKNAHDQMNENEHLRIELQHGEQENKAFKEIVQVSLTKFQEIVLHVFIFTVILVVFVVVVLVVLIVVVFICCFVLVLLFNVLSLLQMHRARGRIRHLRKMHKKEKDSYEEKNV